MEKRCGIRNKPQSDEEIARLADEQHGVVASWQVDLDRHAIHRRLATARLFRKYRGVYAVGRPTLTRKGVWMAAALAYGPDALVSHRTAAALWEIGQSSWKIDVTTPQSTRSRADVRAHTAVLHPEDRSRRDGIPVTSVARTILDLAATLTEDQLARTIENADRLERFDLKSLDRAIARHSRPAGIRKIRKILADYRGAADTRSELERDFRALIHKAGLPEPQYNVIVAGLEVDAYWPQWRLVVELDSRRYHAGSRAFERDRIRDATLQKAACRVLRITHKRLHQQPATVIADVLALSER